MKPKVEIDEERLGKLIKHLLTLEKKTGWPLRKTCRYSPTDCPIENFAPNTNKNGKPFSFAVSRGYVFYGWPNRLSRYKIYELDDSKWWVLLKNEWRVAYTERIIAWLKERK